jgi:hypothetical protein
VEVSEWRKTHECRGNPGEEKSAVAWVKDGRYYQSSRREGGRVISRYWGCGEVAVCVAIIDADMVRKRAELAEGQRRAAEEQQAALESEESRGLGIRLATSAVLEGLGSHRQGRHQWRRRRMGEVQHQQPAPPAVVDETAVEAEMKAAVKAIVRGRDPLAVEQLRRLIKAHSKLAARTVGCDLARFARKMMAR